MPAKLGKSKKRVTPSTGRFSSSKKERETHSGQKRSTGTSRSAPLPKKSNPKGGGLPLLSVWVLAVVVLIGLIHWVASPPNAVRRKPENVAQQPPVRPHKSPEHDRKAAVKPDMPLPPSDSDRHKETDSSSPVNQVASSKQEERLRRDPPLTEKPSTRAGNEQLAAVNVTSDHPAPAHHPSIEPPIPPIAPQLARVAIVIDDFGLDMEVVSKFLSIPLPLTFAVLPHQKYSQEIAHLVHSHHREVLLHLPMQPRGYPLKNPGKGALLTSMSDDAMKSTLQSALDISPHFTGVNNHMGSRFTEDRQCMKTLLTQLRLKGLYFLDSSTSPRSVGFSLAQELQVPTTKRNVFLDHTPYEESVRSQLELLIRKAKVEGSAVAIGHPYAVTLKVLSQEADRFQKEGIAVVSAGELIRGSSTTAHIR